jgi:DNA-binding MarR family transcriptional regulator
MPKKLDPKMTLQTLKALAVFLEKYPQPVSGADIFNQTKMFSGTLYPILSRLEDAGWLTSEWEQLDPSEAGRPRRRFYRLTGAGRARAREELTSLAQHTTGIVPGLKPAGIISS